MRSRGLWHFDAHFHNLLTDGDRLYAAIPALTWRAGP
jgi:hypothetical protein